MTCNKCNMVIFHNDLQSKHHCTHCGETKIMDNGEVEIRNEKDLYDVKIQCPDCLSLFILNPWGRYYCRKCKRLFTESEIRKRCGI